MNYTHSITSKGQITIPKDMRTKLGLDKIGKATISLNEKNEIIIKAPKTLHEVRKLLQKPAHTDPLSEKEKMISTYLAQQYDAS